MKSDNLKKHSSELKLLENGVKKLRIRLENAKKQKLDNILVLESEYKSLLRKFSNKKLTIRRNTEDAYKIFDEIKTYKISCLFCQKKFEKEDPYFRLGWQQKTCSDSCHNSVLDMNYDKLKEREEEQKKRLKEQNIDIFNFDKFKI